jgi:hypothetical protein
LVEAEWYQQQGLDTAINGTSLPLLRRCNPLHQLVPLDILAAEVILLPRHLDSLPYITRMTAAQLLTFDDFLIYVYC